MDFKDGVQKQLKNPNFWKSVGSVSNVGGMACLALSPSFQRLIGKWYKWEICAHVVLTVILTGFMLVAKSDKKERERRWCLSFSTWKILIPSCVLIFSNVGSYYYDKAIGGKPDTLRVISMGLLALSALSLSRLIDMGFEVGFFTFFLGQFVLELVQIHWWLLAVGAILCILAFAARVKSEEGPVLPISGQRQGRASLNQTGGSGNGGSAVEGKESKEEVSEKPQPDPPKPKKKDELEQVKRSNDNPTRYGGGGRPMALVPGPLRRRNQRT